MQSIHIKSEVEVILNEIQDLYQKHQRIALYKLISQVHPIDMALAFRHLDFVEQPDIFKYIHRYFMYINLFLYRPIVIGDLM